MIDQNQLFAWADQAADQHGIPRNLFRNLVGHESSWNPNAVSPKGAVGLTQLMPGTSGDLGVDPTDPRQSLFGGAKYLRQQYDRFGNWDHALAAYNAGAGNVQKYGGIPPFPETQNYVSKIAGSPQNTGSLSEGPSFSNASVLNHPTLLSALGYDKDGTTPSFLRSVPEQNGDVGQNPVGAFGSRLPDPPKTRAEEVLGEMDAPEWLQKLGKYAKGRKSVDHGAHMEAGLGASQGVRGYQPAQDPGEGLTRLLSLLGGLGGGVQSRTRR